MHDLQRLISYQLIEQNFKIYLSTLNDAEEDLIQEDIRDKYDSFESETDLTDTDK